MNNNQRAKVQFNSDERYIMKRIIALLLVGTLTNLASNQLNAGDKEWAVVGKILTGVAAVAVVSDAIDRHHHYAAPRHVVRHAPTVVTVHRPPVHVYTPPQPRIVVRQTPRFARQRTVIVQQAPIVIHQPRTRHRDRSYRQRRYVPPAPVYCPTRY